MELTCFLLLLFSFLFLCVLRPLQFFCISTVINPVTHIDKGRQTQHMRVHKRGPIWKYVRASMTLVNFLPPVFDKGELLVDGGYVNNLPADVMSSLGVNTIIGVDVEDKHNALDPGKMLKLQDSVSGWFVLWRYLVEMLGLAAGRSIPRHKDITAALCYIAHTTQFPRQRALLDLKLEPPCADVGLLDYHRKDEIEQRAFLYAQPFLQAFASQSRALSDTLAHDATPASSLLPMRSHVPPPGAQASVVRSVMPQMLKRSHSRSRRLWSDGMSGGDLFASISEADTPALSSKASVDLVCASWYSSIHLVCACVCACMRVGPVLAGASGLDPAPRPAGLDIACSFARSLAPALSHKHARVHTHTPSHGGPGAACGCEHVILQAVLSRIPSLLCRASSQLAMPW